MQQILQHLKKHGELTDTEIAKAVGIPIHLVRDKLSGLTASGEVVACHVVRMQGENKFDGLVCRISGYIPPAAPGRKPKGSVSQ